MKSLWFWDPGFTRLYDFHVFAARGEKTDRFPLHARLSGRLKGRLRNRLRNPLRPWRGQIRVTFSLFVLLLQIGGVY